ncbi:permease-like cell division protein FtsX [Thiohalorhabdus sp.]|uniref:permease-like cell division protein FtsX n=1 Tax=Thiohalorhabdus sp. TaxID=3094134 RepID=UPI002FC3825C
MKPLRVPLRQHREILGEVIGRLLRQPVATLMTVVVLAAALALPAALLLITDNLERLAERFEEPGKLSVFLVHEGINPKALEDRLRGLDGVANVRYVGPEQALEEATSLLGLGEALEGLPDNPLPGSFEVTISPQQRAPARMAAVADTVSAWSAVDQVQYDRRWVERFQAVVGFLRQTGGVSAVLLGAVVVLIIGNTIRLAVLNRRREIEVIKMIGGTDAFVRLPFVYTGLIQGVAGALLAAVLVAGALAVLNISLADLIAHYDTRFRLRGPDGSYFAVLLLVGAGLGWLGSRLAVGRHLRDIEPA